MSLDKKKDCETCIKLRSPKSFPKGTNVRLPELEDCKTCVVTLSQPLPCNEIIIDLYSDIPCLDGMAGLKTFSVQDIISLFQLRGIPEDCYEEYFNKIVFFHQSYMMGRNEVRKAEDKKRDNSEKVKIVPKAQRIKKK